MSAGSLTTGLLPGGNAFHQSQLVIRHCLEPRIGPAEAAMRGRATQFIPDATAVAYIGLPGTLIWELARG